MATLREVHIKMLELVDRLGNTPVADVLQAFDNDPGIMKQIEKLAELSFIELNTDKTIITVTLHGFFIGVQDNGN